MRKKLTTEEYKAYRAEKARIWYRLNRERALERMKIYNQTYTLSDESRAKQRIRGREYYHKNRERCNAYQAKYRAKQRLLKKESHKPYPKVHECPLCHKLFTNKTYMTNKHITICPNKGETK